MQVCPHRPRRGERAHGSGIPLQSGRGWVVPLHQEFQLCRPLPGHGIRLPFRDSREPRDSQAWLGRPRPLPSTVWNLLGPSRHSGPFPAFQGLNANHMPPPPRPGAPPDWLPLRRGSVPSEKQQTVPWSTQQDSKHSCALWASLEAAGSLKRYLAQIEHLLDMMEA